MRLFMSLALGSALWLAGCDVPVEPGRPEGPASLALFGQGYPGPGDPCLQAGETEVTNPFMDDDAILIACPPGIDAQVLPNSLDAIWMGEVDNWTVFSVRR
tara:strand:+ start:158 stop:460 length:303 start_codon:yes stop_codon:yes gene_type:complete